MNLLLIGSADKTERLLQLTSPGFLLIDDGPLCDAFLDHFKAREFNPTIHSFNPLKGMDYKRARDFATTLYTASPQGENTLTVRNGKRALTKLLLANTTRLDKLRFGASDPEQEAKGMIDDLLLSPVLKGVLCGIKQFSLAGSVVARINRAELGDYDAFVLACLLIGQFQGQVIVPDGGFYLRPLHMSLIRQNRLTCSVTALKELPAAMTLPLFHVKEGLGCTFEDAETLAAYEGLVPNTNEHIGFVQERMG